METAKKAAFAFKSFKIPSFSYNEQNHQNDDIKLGFSPQGQYATKTGVFELTLKLIAYNESRENPIFMLTAVASFQFNPVVPFQEIPKYFYVNAIAIMFPYVRAFVSTFTLQANTALITLNLMNLTGLEKHLIENTVNLP